MTLRWGMVGASGRMGNALTGLLGKPALSCDLAGCRGEGPLDVLFDFSRPEATARVVQLVKHHRCPLVSGTTGLNEDQESEIARLAPLVPLCRAANFSRGVALLVSLAGKIDRALHDWDAEILEAHHSAKVDAPSGTALALAAQLTRPVQPKALRLGGLPGDHALYWASAEEIICVSHRTVDRSALARGAVTAAMALQNKPAGNYNFASLIGVNL